MTNRFCAHSSVILVFICFILIIYLLLFIIIYLIIYFNKHQNNPLVSAETIRHSSTYIILYLL